MRPQLLTSATTLDGRVIDLRIDADGRIESVRDHTDTAPVMPLDVDDDFERVDLSGRLLLAAAVEPHAHLDKAFLSELVVNPTGDLIGAIEAMRANRHLFTVGETVERAERAARLMAANGYVAVRTHADVTTEHGLTSIEALVQVRERVADIIDVEIVALCGSPVSGAAGADQRALLRAALSAGADLVGGCPHLEKFGGDGDIASATEVLLGVADEFRRPVDLHTDETLDPLADGLDRLATAVLAGFDLPVTASHCVSLGQQAADQQASTAERVAEAGIAVVTLPHTNLFLQGRGVTPMPRALTAVAALRAAGVTVAAGADNLQDPFNPLGRACPFETAGLMVLAAHMLPDEAWRMVSSDSNRVVAGPGPDETAQGFVNGTTANLLSVPAETIREAIALAPSDRWVWRAGRRR